MSEQPNALRLADELEHEWGDDDEAAAELRRLHAELERKSDAIQRLWKERDELRGENDALREANEAFGKRQQWWNDRMFQMEQEVAAHRTFCGEIYKALDTDEPDRQKWPSMIRALRADAERWRFATTELPWVLSTFPDSPRFCISLPVSVFDPEVHDDPDSAIDAAIAAQRQEETK